MKIAFQVATLLGTERKFTKRKLIPIEDLDKKIIIAWKEKKEIFHSLILRDSNQDYAPFIFIDIDNKTNLEEAKKSTQLVYDYLKPIFGEPALRIYYSGSKGFHIYLSFQLENEDELNIIKTDKGIRSFFTFLNSTILSSSTPIDMRAVGNKRMVRCINSYHATSRLFKVELSRKDLDLNVPEIFNIARKPDLQVFKKEGGVLGKPNSSPPLDEQALRTLVSSLALDVEKTIPKPALKLKKEKPPAELPSFDAFYSTKGIVDGCQAIRKLVYEISSGKEPPVGWRLNLTRALTESDEREKFITSVLSCHPNYRKEITEAQLDKLKSFSISCEEMISSSMCQNYCERYLLKNCTSANTPSYFGSKNNQKWFQNSSYDSLQENLRGLIRYFGSTTDFFDWGNLDNIQNYLHPFILDVSEKIRKGQVPDIPLMLFKVTKPNGKERTLSMNHLETELFLSCFLREMLQESEKIILSFYPENYHAFGYSRVGKENNLIAPWYEEYNQYKEKLKFYINHERYKYVLTDDIKDFYPSFGIEKINKILDGYESLDPRAHFILLNYFKGLRYINSKDGNEVGSNGLPQGPLISHVLASKHLIEVDLLIQKRLKGKDYAVVRYCDDISIFFATQEDLELFQNSIIQTIEKDFGLSFHKDYLGEDKSFAGTVEKYRDEKLLRDLAKYDLSLQLDLSVFDEESREKLISSIHDIFGSALEMLKVDTASNLKDFERQISSLSWKLPEILKNEKKKETVQELLDVIIKVMSNEKASWRLINSSLVIYLGFVKYSDEKSTWDRIISSIKTNPNLSPALSMHLARSLFILDNENLRRFGESLIASMEKQSLDYGYLSSFLLPRVDGEIVKTGLWNFFQQKSHIRSFNDFLTSVFSAIDNLDLENTLLGEGSRFKIMSDLLLLRVEQQIENYGEEKLKYLARISDQFRLDDLYNLVVIKLRSIGAGVEELLNKIHGSTHLITLKSVSAQILSKPIESLVPLRSIRNGLVFQVDSKIYTVEYVHLPEFKTHAKTKRVFDRIVQTTLVDAINIIKTPDRNYFYLLSMMSSNEIESFTPYLDFSESTVEDLDLKLNVENIFNKISPHSLLIPACSLHYSTSQKRFRSITPSVIVKSTLSKRYILSNDLSVKVKNDKMGLPGLRLLEASIGPDSIYSRRKSFTDDLIIHSYNLMSSESDVTNNLWNEKKCKYFYKSLSDYRKISANIFFHKELETFYKLAYDLFKKISRKSHRTYFRNQNHFKSQEFTRFLEIFKEVASGIPSFYEDLSSDKSADHFKAVKVLSYNHAVGFNLISNIKKHSDTDHKDYQPVFKIIGLASMYFMNLALEELNKDFGIKNGEWRSLSLKTELTKHKKYFIFPTLGDLSIYEEAWDKVLKFDPKMVTKLDLNFEPFLIKGKFELYPHGPNEVNETRFLKDMARDFKNIKATIIFEGYDRDDDRSKTFIQIIDGAFSYLSVFVDLLLYSLAKKEYNDRLSKVLTLLCSLDLDTYLKLTNGKAFVSFGLNRFRVIKIKKIYPETMSVLLPKQFNVFTENRRKILYRCVGSLIVAFVMLSYILVAK